MADVSGGEGIGGLVGLIWSTSGTCYLTNCYAAGSVSGSHYLGGLVGTNYDGIVADSVWDKETTGQYFSGGGIGKTTWQMQNEGTYEHLGWDLATPIWSVCPATGYPVLWWQQCQPNPGGVTVLWTEREGGSYNDHGGEVIVDQNGDIVASGTTYLKHDTETNTDLFVVKYAPSGRKLWELIYDFDPSGDSNEKLEDMAIDDDGNIYVTGSCYHDSRDILTLKIDSNGTLQWAETFDGLYNDIDEPSEMALDHMGNIYIAGKSDTSRLYDYSLLKYTPNGVLEWNRYYNGEADYGDYAHDICIDTDDNIYVTGASDGSEGGGDIVTLKYNVDGDLIWDEVYDCPLGANIFFGEKGIAVDSNGDIYVTAIIDEDGDENIVLLKYDSDGTLVWPIIYDRAGNDDSVNLIVLDDSDNIYLAGRTFTSETVADYLIVKYNPEGVELWSKVYNGPDSNMDFVQGIAVDDEQNVFVTGVTDYVNPTSDSSCTTFKYDSEGTVLWSTDYETLGRDIEIPYDIAVSENRIYVVGDFAGKWLDLDFRIICYAECSFTGDTNTDFKVNLIDFAALAGQWLETSCDECEKADFTGDQSVLFDDVVKLAANWLKGVY
jgi:uncharacterized delta-60 repeat protein